MRSYEHSQRGTFILVAMLGLAAGMSLLGWFATKPLLIAVPILVLAAWLFHSLTIEITGSELHWRFGPGLIRKRIALADIASICVVRTNFLEGWGIPLSRFGWLYNVSGFDAVAITLSNGRRFALGTDEAEELL